MKPMSYSSGLFLLVVGALVYYAAAVVESLREELIYMGVIMMTFSVFLLVAAYVLKDEHFDRPRRGRKKLVLTDRHKEL